MTEAILGDAADKSPEVFDPARFLESIGHDLVAFGELASMFGPIAAEQSARLAKLLRAGEWLAARDVAHSLKGSLSLFGTRPAIGILDRLEQDCAQRVPLDAEARLREVELMLAQVNAELLAYCEAQGIALSS